MVRFDLMKILKIDVLFYLLANAWVVFVVDNGVGHDCECRGFHIIDLSIKDKGNS